MTVTIILSVIMMAALFLLLFAGVALIQDMRLFSSAPPAVLDVIQPKEERFPGQHIIGWVLGGIALTALIGPIIYGGWDGIQKGFGFGGFFARFITMLLLLKAFDILFFDLYLLCHSRFYLHYYPEAEGLTGPETFGFNKRSHVIQIAFAFALSAVLAGICVMLS